MSPRHPNSRAASSAPTVLVLGTGYVGRRFLARTSAGTAIGLNRSAIDSPRQVEIHDLDTGGDLPVELPDRYTVLYTVPPALDSESDRRLEDFTNTLTTAPVRLVYISTTGVYGNHDGKPVNEEVPATPQADRTRRRLAAEDHLRSWGVKRGIDIVILRAPGIYGPGRLGIERIRAGTPIIAEAEAGPGNRIHVDDLVTCCEAALASDVPAGLYNVGDGDHRSASWFSIELARQCALDPPPTISMADAEHKLSPMHLSFLRESRRVSTQKMRDVLGVTPQYPNAEDGIRASLRDE